MTRPTRPTLPPPTVRPPPGSPRMGPRARRSSTCDGSRRALFRKRPLGAGGRRLERGEPALGRLRDELAGVDPELPQLGGVLFVVDLRRQLLDRGLDVLGLAGLLELVQDELLIDLHRSPLSRSWPRLS